MKITSKLVGASLALAGAMSLSAMNDSALAASTSQPGELVGYTWAPLPVGIYFATTESYGNARGSSTDTDKFVSIPVMIWSTPWTFLGGRIEAYGAVPSASVTIPHPAPTLHLSGVIVPYFNVGEAWDLGGGWAISQFFGGYAPSNGLGGLYDYFTFNSRTGVTWAQGPWSLSAHVIVGIPGNNASSGPLGGIGLKTAPDYVDLDLTGTYTIGKWSLGVAAFGSWDVSNVSYTGTPYAKQSQFAVGPFVAYNFGPVILQTYITRDVYVNNYEESPGLKTYETRGWVRAIVPLWTAPAPAPVIAKY